MLNPVPPQPMDDETPVPPPRPEPWTWHLGIVALTLATVALLKTVRLPNLWAATHYTFNYSRGFIRRGLVGELIRRVGGEGAYRYKTLAGIAIALFTLLAALMTQMIWRTLRRYPDAGLWGALLVFLASPSLVFIIHLIGYLDYVGASVDVLVVLLIFDSTRRRRWLAPVSLFSSIFLAFIHESALVLAVPLLIFQMVCALTDDSGRLRSSTPRRRLVAWLEPAVVLGGAAAASVIIGTVGTRPPDFVHELMRETQKVADFPLRADAFNVLFQSVITSWRHDMPAFWREPGAVRFFFRGLSATAPGLAFLLIYGLRLIRTCAAPLLPRMRVILKVTFVATSLAPLLMLLVGWDFERWNALSTLSAFICVCILKLGPCAATAEIPRSAKELSGLLTLGAIAVVLGLCTNYYFFLFDDYKLHWFPFDDRWEEIRELLTGNSQLRPNH